MKITNCLSLVFALTIISSVELRAARFSFIPGPRDAQTLSLETIEDQAEGVDLAINGVNSAIYSFEIISGPSHGVALIEGNRLTYTPEENFNGSDEIVYRGINPYGLTSNSATISITVSEVNDPPTANELPTQEVEEDGSLDIELSGSDIDSSSLSIEIVQDPQYGSLIVGESGHYTYLPQSNFAGKESFTFRFFDGQAYSEESTVYISVVAVSDILDGVSSLDEVSEVYDPITPLTNAKGVVMLENGEQLFIYVDRGQLMLGRKSSSGIELTQLATGSGTPTIAVSGAEVIVAYIESSSKVIKVLNSHDYGLTFAAAVSVGSGSVGPALVTACVWKQEAQVNSAVAWASPPTSEDGGPLYVAMMNNGVWEEATRVGSSSMYSAASLACSSEQQSLVVRDDPGSNLEVKISERGSDGAWSEPVKLVNGADPSYCVSGEDRWVSYHYRTQVYLMHSSDNGATYSSQSVATYAKFSNVSCQSGGRALVSYGQWPSVEAAESRDDSTRQVMAQYTDDGGTSLSLIDAVQGEVGQATATVDLAEDGFAIYWRTQDDVLRLYID